MQLHEKKQKKSSAPTRGNKEAPGKGIQLLFSIGPVKSGVAYGKEQGKMASLQGVFSDLFVVENTDGADNGFEKLIALMKDQGLSFYQREGKNTENGGHGLIARDDVIIIKVNSQWDQRGGTSTDLVKSIIEAIVEHPDGFTGEIVVADNGQAQFGAKGRGGMGTQMRETRMPVLNVLDAIWISPRFGPGVSYSQALENNMIAASTDPIALDYWSAKNILMKVARRESNPHTDSMNPDIVTRGSFGYWLRLSMDELNEAGYETTLGDENIRVFFPPT